MEKKGFTIEVKLLNRVEPIGLDDYKRAQKMPKRIRREPGDHLNRFLRTTRPVENYQAGQVFGQELTRLIEAMPWNLSGDMELGETFIGWVSMVEFSDFYRPIYQRTRKVEYYD